MTFSATKFEVARSKSLGGDTFTRNVTDGRTTDQLWYEIKGNFGFVHAHHSCGGKRGKLSGSRLSTIFKFASIQVLHTFRSGRYFRIFWTK